MKYLIALILGLIISIGTVAAQRPTDLKGPAAKNYKPWRDKDKVKTKVVTMRKERLQGPAAKNYKPWANKAKRTPGVKIAEAKPKLKGPAAKNYKPWRD